MILRGQALADARICDGVGEDGVRCGRPFGGATSGGSPFGGRTLGRTTVCRSMIVDLPILGRIVRSASACGTVLRGAIVGGYAVRGNVRCGATIVGVAVCSTTGCWSIADSKPAGGLVLRGPVLFGQVLCSPTLCGPTLCGPTLCGPTSRHATFSGGTVHSARVGAGVSEDRPGRSPSGAGKPIPCHGTRHWFDHGGSRGPSLLGGFPQGLPTG
jgi:hypothetical protein